MADHNKQEPDYIQAHKHSSGHRQEIGESKVCGCFSCLAMFVIRSIFQWIDEDKDGMGQTALCPNCGIDAVIGSASGYPVTLEFLKKMEKHWFGLEPEDDDMGNDPDKSISLPVIDSPEIDTVAFILIKDQKVLAERRKPDKQPDPGKVVIPGGHIEEGEQARDALIREVQEELNIRPLQSFYICSLLHITGEPMRIQYYYVKEWDGNIQSNEAEELMWIPLDKLESLDFEVDRVAIRECLRIQEAGWLDDW
jgi:8-oxo-dGTP diphosphatase